MDVALGVCPYRPLSESAVEVVGGGETVGVGMCLLPLSVGQEGGEGAACDEFDLGGEVGRRRRRRGNLVWVEDW